MEPNQKMMQSFKVLRRDFNKYAMEMNPKEFAKNLGMQVAAVVFEIGMSTQSIGDFVGSFIVEFLNQMSSMGIHIIDESALKNNLPMSGPN